MHKLLSRQLKHLAYTENEDGSVDINASEWRELLNIIDRTYQQYDDEKGMIERTMALVSDELSERNDELSKNLKELKRNQETIRHQALHDGLTSLPNRSLFMDRLEHAIQYSSSEDLKLAILFIDLDHFKKINDSCGHQEGDKVLQDVSQRIYGCIRAHDTLARFGGDEFVILVEGLKDLEPVKKISSRILRAVTRPYRINNSDFHLSASIGISLYPESANDGQRLIRQADMAMYHAKESGRDNVKYFDSGMEEMAIQGITIEQSLRRAIAAKEFNLFYQPKVSTVTREILGFEALIRWTPPGEEPISPDHFIPLAERTGLITLIGCWVIDEACAQIRRWQDMGLPVRPIAINLSTKELLSPSLLDDIKQALDRYQISVDLLEIEITETVIMENIEAACSVLNQVRDLGVNVALDDFGTGYSSLSYLQKLPINFLKIDKSFILDLSSGSRNSSIVAAIIALGHNMGLSIIAEGVEDIQAYNFLKEKNCDCLQGYYFHRPDDAIKTTELLKKLAE